jgi:threonine/homoserine/homoserine lactone efflux protein
VFAADQLAGFLAAVTVLVLVPGPNTALILAHSLGGGRRAGLATVAGVELGTVVHTLAAAFGLSAVLSTSALAFDAVKLAGAGVLVFLGAREMLRAGERIPAAGPALGVGRALARAVAGNVLNPKVAIFFLAFLPQWVDPARGALLPQFLVLGAIVSSVGWIFGSAMALAAGALAPRLERHAAFWRWQRRATGGVLMAIGLRLALTRAS